MLNNYPPPARNLNDFLRSLPQSDAAYQVAVASIVEQVEAAPPVALNRSPDTRLGLRRRVSSDRIRAVVPLFHAIGNSLFLTSLTLVIDPVGLTIHELQNFRDLDIVRALVEMRGIRTLNITLRSPINGLEDYPRSYM
jgi:hypothetical protein